MCEGYKEEEQFRYMKNKIDTIVIVRIVKDYITKSIKEFIERKRKV